MDADGAGARLGYAARARFLGRPAVGGRGLALGEWNSQPRRWCAARLKKTRESIVRQELLLTTGFLLAAGIPVVIVGVAGIP